MKGIIDRFEGEFAVIELENREMINIVKHKIPQSAKEGTVLIINGDKVTIDIEETNRLYKEIKALEEDLWK